METNKMASVKGETCDSGHCCKHRRCLAVGVIIVVLMAAFSAGLALGHGGNRDGYNRSRFGGIGCGRGNFEGFRAGNQYESQGGRGYQSGGYRNGNGAQVEESASTTTGVASSTLITK